MSDTGSNQSKVIYNCHNHIFTHENLPNNYIIPGLVPAARIKPLNMALQLIMKGIVPGTKNDKIHRFSNFFSAAYRESQEKNLETLVLQYPTGTRFIILPMDMEHMGAGNVKEGIEEQHAELARIYKNQKYREILIPFAHIDPRHPDAFERLKNLVKVHGFKGVKIYPPLGYSPDDPALIREIYPYMIEKNIPLMAHCSPGSVYSDDMKKKAANALADPFNYRDMLNAHEDLKDLRICLAHFGGIDEWRRHLNEPRDDDNPTWVSKITEMMLSGDYPNLYTDISYTIFNFQENIPFLKVLLEEPAIRSKVLFGSDFYMILSKKYPEKRLSIDLRAELKETFWDIANSNPRRYLYGPSNTQTPASVP